MKNPQAVITVSGFGQLTLDLYPHIALNTVNNFIHLAKTNQYDGTVFHRVIKNFMIQGGALKTPASPIKGEFTLAGYENNLLHKRGVISMARLGNDFHSQTSQFFICHRDAPHLDGSYASFGLLVDGFEILDQIAAVRKDERDQPYDDVIIEKIHINLNGFTPSDPIYYHKADGAHE